MPTPEDWLTSTTKQRKDLHQFVLRLIKLKELTWDQISKDAVKATLSKSFLENFRQGRIGADRAAEIYGYLLQKFPRKIHVLDAQAFTAKRFTDFLMSFRRLGLLELLPEILGPSFVAQRLGPEWAEYPFETAGPICFRLRLPFYYEAAIALNGCSAGWFPLRLGQPTQQEMALAQPPLSWIPPSSLIKPVTQGAQTFCTLAPTPEEATARLGANIFVFIAGEFDLLADFSQNWKPTSAVPHDELELLGERLTVTLSHSWAVTQINANGVGPF